MSGLPFTNPPDPLNSPNEKIELARRGAFRQKGLLSNLLREEGVDPHLAAPLGRAIERFEDDRDFRLQRLLDELLVWSNTHTHPGGTEGGPGVPIEEVWSNFWWASDPNYEAPEDGASASPWPDTKGANPFEGSKPIYVASAPEFSGLAAIDVSPLTSTFNFKAEGVVNMPQPFTFVILFHPLEDFSGVKRLVSTGLDGYTDDTEFKTFNGTTLASPFGSALPDETQLVLFEINSVDTSIERNGEVLVVGDSGTRDREGVIYLGSTSGGTFNFNMLVGFLGIAEGVLTPEQKQELLDFAVDNYGVIPA